VLPAPDRAPLETFPDERLAQRNVEDVEPIQLASIKDDAAPLRPTAMRDPIALNLALPTETEAPAPPKPTGIVRGVVTDALTDLPITGATVRLDLSASEPISVTTDDEGQYVLAVPEIPEFIALSASMEAYAPESVNVPASALKQGVVTRDFELAPERRDIIVLEQDPDVHHLGDDEYTGRINSQFQKLSEGRYYIATFHVPADTLVGAGEYASIELLARGTQRDNEIRINDRLVGRGLNRAPRDGSYGPFEARFPASWLEEGVNFIEIRSVYRGSDLDDFEFVNIRIRLPDEEDAEPETCWDRGR
jgi:hypothetical protein